jgi:hypothetical protein
MAQKVQTIFIDDLDGSQADGTVRFGLECATRRCCFRMEVGDLHRPAVAAAG